MKRFTQMALTLSLFVLLLGNVWAQDQTQKETKEQIQTTVKTQTNLQMKKQAAKQVIHGPWFVDRNGDGYNDNAPDHDGDGIPNGQDPDYQGAGKGKMQQRFVDTDGDGIADNVGTGNRRGFGKRGFRRGGYGPGNGTGNQGVRPQNGSGYGPGAGSGNCDGTGPKGRTNRGPQE